MRERIMIVEDDREIGGLLSRILRANGYQTDYADNGADAIRKLREIPYDLLILDLMLPVKSGDRVLRELRTFSNLPVIIVSAKDLTGTKVDLLRLGADDYITKPFGLRELIARVKANIRRTGMTEVVGADPANVQDYGNITIDLNRYEARKNGTALELTLREFELLRYLAEREDKVYSREQLLEDVWGYEYYGDIRTVDVTVRRLREKLEDDSSNPKYILTKRGVGYYFHRPE